MAFSVNGNNGSRSGLGKRRYGGGIGTLSEINIIPLVDVVLVLLIIFMLTAHVMEFGLEISVPEVKQVKDSAEELPVISITRSGRIFLNERPVNINEIASEVQKRFKNSKSVYVMADKATVYDPIAQVISTLDESKLAVKLVTKPQELSGGQVMEQHADILDQREPMSRAFAAALALHVTLIGVAGIYSWVNLHRDSFGAKDAGGGAIGIEAVSAIPIPRTGAQNPVANDTDSQVPQQPTKPVEQARREKESPKAVGLKFKQKKRLSDVASEHQRFRPFKEIDPNQVFATQAPQVSNPLFAAMPGSGRIGTGANTTLGTRFAGYAAQIQQLIAQKWHTSDVDAHVQTAPEVVATFELMRDGRIRNLKILQPSGISTLDYSVQRAILEASPFPPIPPGFDRDSARVEFWFELKR